MALCLPQSATAFVLSPEALVQAVAPHICKTGSLLVSPDSQEPLRAVERPVGSLGMPLGRHSFMPDHFPCPGCRARRRVRSVLAGGIKSPLYLNFLPIQGRACWEMRWTGLRQIRCNPSLCSQHQEHQTSCAKPGFSHAPLFQGPGSQAAHQPGSSSCHPASASFLCQVAPLSCFSRHLQRGPRAVSDSPHFSGHATGLIWAE